MMRRECFRFSRYTVQGFDMAGTLTQADSNLHRAVGIDTLHGITVFEPASSGSLERAIIIRVASRSCTARGALPAEFQGSEKTR